MARADSSLPGQTNQTHKISSDKDGREFIDLHTMYQGWINMLNFLPQESPDLRSFLVVAEVKDNVGKG